jgi:hypothetical protein
MLVVDIKIQRKAASVCVCVSVLSIYAIRSTAVSVRRIQRGRENGGCGGRVLFSTSLSFLTLQFLFFYTAVKVTTLYSFCV